MNFLAPTKKAKPEDIQCIILARLGFSYKLIRERTGLSTGQISYRLRYVGIGLKHYRNGQTKFAQQVIDLSRGESKQIVNLIKTKLLENK